MESIWNRWKRSLWYLILIVFKIKCWCHHYSVYSVTAFLRSSERKVQCIPPFRKVPRNLLLLVTKMWTEKVHTWRSFPLILCLFVWSVRPWPCEMLRAFSFVDLRRWCHTSLYQPGIWRGEHCESFRTLGSAAPGIFKYLLCSYN